MIAGKFHKTALLLLAGMVAAIAPPVPRAGAEDKKEDEVVKLTADDVKSVRRGNNEAVATAKKKWAGKVAEITIVRWASHQDQTDKSHAGQTLFSFDVGRGETGKRTDILIPVYFKDELDIRFLKNLHISDETTRKVRGKIMVDKFGWRLWLEDGRLVRSKEDRDKQEKEEKEALEAVENLEKTADGKAVKLTGPAVKAMLRRDSRIEAIVKKKWAGKVGELTARGWNSAQDQTSGPHAGEVLFGFDPGEAAAGKRTGVVLAVYFKNNADAKLLKARKLGDKTPFKVRGKITADPYGFRLWLTDGRLVKEEK
jgi:hypothetical protein